MKISKKFILLIAACGLIAGPTSSIKAYKQNQTTHKKSKRDHHGRGARTAGFLGGATVAGAAVGATKGAGWGVLGAAGGGLAGYFLVRAIQKGRRNRKNHEHKNKEMKTNRTR